MTGQQQRDELHRQIWAIANDVRGAVDGWDFKQFVLGALFYRFISENFVNYAEAGDDSINYAGMPDSDVPDDFVIEAVKTKGYFIFPSQLFSNVVSQANTNDSLNTDLAAIFAAIEGSANGYPSEEDISGLFADFDTTSNRLGNTVKDKNARLAAVLKGVAGLPLTFDDSQRDLFGDAYEFLIKNYAANAGKSGGEFFTPPHVSRLIAKIAIHGQTTINKIFDPACGSGSLLLQAKYFLKDHGVEEGYFGQEINHTTYNLARMNMFLHNINYDKFNIQLGNTLTDPHFGDDKPFDAIVSNPPYSIKWKGSDDPTLINDERFAPAGVLAPKSKADFAFVLHALSYLSAKGRAALVCFPGIFYRGGAEQKIRKYLVDNNYVEAVIALAPNLFYGTTIAVNILVLARNKQNTDVQFIDATGEDFFDKKTNNNEMSDDHIAEVMRLFDSKENEAHIAETVDQSKIIEQDYNLSVSAYVEPKDTRVVTNITELNEKLVTTVAKIDQLRSDIDAIVADIGVSDLGFLENLLDGADVEWKPLGEMTNVKTGQSVNKNKIASNPGPYAVINSGREPLGFIDEWNTDNDPIGVTTRGAGVGSITWREGKYFRGNLNYAVSIKPEANLETRYLYHLLLEKQAEIHALCTFDGIPALNASKLKVLLIPVPCPEDPEKSLAIQAEVVRILDSFTELTGELTAELTARKKQYNHYRNQLLSSPKPEEPA
ncbi:type I restriction-modification system subunit M [Sulfitobacter pontiacus]|uniref:type I restriction-modification system subunit M n=1 Tax=Sulfitobacter pontiacus TaxID=60137 RepID=UPI0015DD6FB2|nr:type I restriction-modification system subunit M [Sulfitobacter pontiacus]QLL43318.1 type I restriction-modification system subunit M [Sulfitobacter pontiacus]